MPCLSLKTIQISIGFCISISRRWIFDFLGFDDQPFAGSVSIRMQNKLQTLAIEAFIFRTLIRAIREGWIFDFHAGSRQEVIATWLFPHYLCLGTILILDAHVVPTSNQRQSHTMETVGTWGSRDKPGTQNIDIAQEPLSGFERTEARQNDFQLAVLLLGGRWERMLIMPRSDEPAFRDVRAETLSEASFFTSKDVPVHLKPRSRFCQARWPCHGRVIIVNMYFLQISDTSQADRRFVSFKLCNSRLLTWQLVLDSHHPKALTVF